MSKRVALFLTVLAALVLVPLVASAQMAPEPPTYTYVSEWAIPRAQWKEWTDSNEKNNKPIYEKMMADGTIIGYGLYNIFVHDESGITHGSWFETASLAAVDKVMAEIVKLPPNPVANAATKHRDYLIRSSLRRIKAGSGHDGYLWVNYTQLQPGKAAGWRALYDKLVKPVFDEMLGNGALLAYWVEGEHVHTDNPDGVYIVLLFPNADAMDKYFAAIQKLIAQNPGVGELLAGVTAGAAHRDYLARVTHYANK